MDKLPVFKIPARNLDWLAVKLEKMNKRAVKLGAELIVSHIGAYTPATFTLEGRLLSAATYDISVSGLTPKLAGWRFVGSVEHTEFGNVLRGLPGETMPEEYRHAEKFCDHCKTKRDRKDTYLVRSDEGQVKQIGRTCVRDFTGGASPEYFAKLAEWMRDIERLCDPDAEAEDYRTGRREPGVEVNEFFQFCAQEILTRGYSKGMGRAMFSDIIQATFDKDARLREVVVTPSAYELAEKAITWALNVMPLESAFSRNMETLLKKSLDQRVVAMRDSGILAYAIEAYRLDVINPKVRAVAPPQAVSEFKGEIGARITWEKLTVMKSIYLRDFEYYIILFKDSRGNVFKWSTSQGLLEGSDYEVTGRIKAFDEYKGVKQTVLTRCKVEEIGVSNG